MIKNRKIVNAINEDLELSESNDEFNDKSDDASDDKSDVE